MYGRGGGASRHQIRGGGVRVPSPDQLERVRRRRQKRPCRAGKPGGSLRPCPRAAICTRWRRRGDPKRRRVQISIITPLFNRLDLTRACVASARDTLDGWEYEWIFVDDGSTDGTRDFLRSLAGEDPRVRVVCNDAPRGFAANNNHAARLARAPLLCLLNNDTSLLPGWLEPMASLARLLPDVACVGNVQREPVSGLIDHAGVFFDRNGDARHAAKDASAPPRGDYLEWPAVTAACWVVRRRVFQELGGFDEAFRNGFEDIDFCLRAGQRGFRHFVANRSVIYHHISASPGRKQGEQDNLRLFRERWVGFLQGEGSGRLARERQREEGRQYLRKHRWTPWRFNGRRLVQAVKQAWAPRPRPRPRPRGLGPWPRLSLRAREFFRPRFSGPTRRRPAAGPAAGAPVFLVVGDTALCRERTGVPTAVRSLAGGLGRTGAPVRLVRWKAATRSLCLLPPQLSVGLDAEGLRAEPGESAGPSIFDPAMGEFDAPFADTPSLHELPAGAVPPGAWVLLPEVLYQERTEQLRDYVQRHGWKLAVILHDLMPTNEPPWFPLGRPHEHELYLRAVSRADLVLPVSRLVEGDWWQFVTAKGLPDPPRAVCTPGADTSGRTRTTGGPRPRDPGEPWRILCVSAVAPRKNHRALLAAFERVLAARPETKFELRLVGRPQLFSEDNVPEAVRAFVERHPPGTVTWTEWIEYSALGGHYAQCDFTVFPSALEGWPAPVVESLWAGRPCVCAAHGVMADVARGGGCVTVDVHDGQALADALLALTDAPERLAALAAEIDARPLPTWEDYAREVLGHLRPPPEG